MKTDKAQGFIFENSAIRGQIVFVGFAEAVVDEVAVLYTG